MKRYFLFAFVFIVFTTLFLVAFRIYKPEVEILSVENLAMQEEYLVLRVGEQEVLLASIYPYNANNQNIIWTSSNEAVASVENGVVTAHQVGNVQITATSEEGGYQDYCYVDIISD